MAPPTPPVIHIRNLKKSFGKNDVLRGFDLDLFPGENVAVLGRSGSGKSVLIKCVVGLLEPDSGVLEVFGQSVQGLNRRKMDEIRKRIGFLFQGNALYDSMTIRENLAFTLRRHKKKGLGKEELEQRIREGLKSVNLEHTIEMMPAELSGGMKKRIALARALVLRPDIILYDEPTSGLDPVTAREISQLIVKVQKEHNAAAIVITHDLECAHITANRIAILVDGLNHASGSYEELAASQDPPVHSFFHS